MRTIFGSDNAITLIDMRERRDGMTAIDGVDIDEEEN